MQFFSNIDFLRYSAFNVDRLASIRILYPVDNDMATIVNGK